MVDKKQAESIQLRYGLTLRRILNENKSKAAHLSKRDRIDSFDKLEASSGLRKATLADIAAGKSNPSGTSIAVILEALGLTMSEFGAYYDAITEKEIIAYKKELEEARKERIQNAKNAQRKRKDYKGKK